MDGIPLGENGRTLRALTLSCHHHLLHPSVLVQQPRELLYPTVLSQRESRRHVNTTAGPSEGFTWGPTLCGGTLRRDATWNLRDTSTGSSASSLLPTEPGFSVVCPLGRCERSCLCSKARSPVSSHKQAFKGLKRFWVWKLTTSQPSQGSLRSLSPGSTIVLCSYTQRQIKLTPACLSPTPSPVPGESEIPCPTDGFPEEIISFSKGLGAWEATQILALDRLGGGGDESWLHYLLLPELGQKPSSALNLSLLSCKMQGCDPQSCLSQADAL